MPVLTTISSPVIGCPCESMATTRMRRERGTVPKSRSSVYGGDAARGDLLAVEPELHGLDAAAADDRLDGLHAADDAPSVQRHDAQPRARRLHVFAGSSPASAVSSVGFGAVATISGTLSSFSRIALRAGGGSVTFTRDLYVAGRSKRSMTIGSFSSCMSPGKSKR